MIYNDTIVALATPSGAGAIAIIRLSGKDAITIAEKHFKSVSGKKLSKQKTHTIHLGHIIDKNTTDEKIKTEFPAFPGGISSDLPPWPLFRYPRF